jgi:hypothetical protein
MAISLSPIMDLSPTKRSMRQWMDRGITWARLRSRTAAEERWKNSILEEYDGTSTTYFRTNTVLVELSIRAHARVAALACSYCASTVIVEVRQS